MTKILAFWGAPGAGKSAASFMITGEMKARGISVELVPEFPKELAWAGDTERLKDQLFIFAEQNRRLYTLLGKVDWIVTDMALPITIPYLHMPDRCCNYGVDDATLLRWKHKISDVVVDTWGMYDTHDVFIRRDVPYDQNGRMETEKQSLIIEKNIFADFSRFGKNKIITTTSQYKSDVVSALIGSGNL